MPMALQSNPWLGNTRDPNQQQKVQHIIFVTPETPQQAPQPQPQQQQEDRGLLEGLLKIPTSIKTAPYTHTERFTQTEARPAVYQRVCLEAQPGQAQQPQQQQSGPCKPGEAAMFDAKMQQQQQQQQQGSAPSQMYTTEKAKEETKPSTNTVEFPFCYNVNMVPKGQGEEQKCYRFDAVQPFSGYNYALVNQMSLAAAASTATFKCDVCGLAFAHLTLLNHHKRIHTANTNTSAPDNTNQPASTNTVVTTAQQTVNTPPTTVERPHACDLCSAAFAMPGELKAHKHTAHKLPPAPKCCNSCGVEIPCEHSKGKKGKFVKCENCQDSAHQASFVSGNGTSEASSGESSEVPIVKPGHHPVKRRGMATVTKCQKCNGSGIIFVGGTRSTVDKPFHCNVCDGTFSRYSSLWSHKRLHSGEKPFKCEICGLAFAKAAYLKNHGRVHTGEKPYKCSVCGMQFSQSPHLKNHERIHSGERPYQCEVCDKMFARHSTLWNHRRIHTGEKPYRCNVCGSAFNQATHLKNHTKVHTGEKPHRCDICDVGFSDRFALKRHRGIHEKYGRTAPNSANSTANPANGAGNVQQNVQQNQQPPQQQQQPQQQVGQVIEELYKCEVRNQVPDYSGQGGDTGGTA